MPEKPPMSPPITGALGEGCGGAAGTCWVAWVAMIYSSQLSCAADGTAYIPTDFGAQHSPGRATVDEADHGSGNLEHLADQRALFLLFFLFDFHPLIVIGHRQFQRRHRALRVHHRPLRLRDQSFFVEQRSRIGGKVAETVRGHVLAIIGLGVLLPRRKHLLLLL